MLATQIYETLIIIEKVKLLCIDLKNLTNWLNTNKISLNISKTEITIFKPKRKVLESNIKIKFSGKRLYPTVLVVKYHGVKADSKLNLKDHVNAIATKLNFYRVKDFVNAGIFKSTCYILFESHIKVPVKVPNTLNYLLSY